jgi:ATP synthase protein I
LNARPENERTANRLDEAVKTRRERVERWKREGERSLGENLAMIGSLGWLVVVPTLIGIFVGRWMDRTFDSGIFWTLGLLVVGVAIGSALAWQRMFHE